MNAKNNTIKVTDRELNTIVAALRIAQREIRYYFWDEPEVTKAEIDKLIEEIIESPVE